MQEVTEKFRKLTKEECCDYGGGWAIFAIMATALPLLINSVAQLLTAVKMFDSDSGSLKTSGGYESHWANEHEASKSKSTSRNHDMTKTLVYAY